MPGETRNRTVAQPGGLSGMAYSWRWAGNLLEGLRGGKKGPLTRSRHSAATRGNRDREAEINSRSRKTRIGERKRNPAGWRWH